MNPNLQTCQPDVGLAEISNYLLFIHNKKWGLV
jgi:hypothetical protein